MSTLGLRDASNEVGSEAAEAGERPPLEAPLTLY